MLPLGLLIFVGFVIRLLFIGNTGFVADISFWKSWSLAAIDHGIVWTTHNTNINYPPGFIYILWLMGKIYSFIGNPHDYYNFWTENNFAFLFVSKMFPIVSDILITVMIYWFFSQKKTLEKLGAYIKIDYKNLSPNIQILYKNLPLILATIFYLSPVVIIDSALWGQVESIGILFTLTAIILLFYRHPLMATAIFTTGTLLKLQNIIFIPLYFLFILRYYDFRTLAKSLGIAALAFFTVCLPFVLANNMDRILFLMTLNNDYFPWMSLNAHNLWWIVSNAKGMTTIDKITVLGILNAKQVGLIIYSGIYFLLCLILFKKPTPKNFLIALSTSIFAFFLFTTQSHERYSYPVLVLLLFFFPFIEAAGSNNVSKFSLQKSEFGIKYFWVFYTLLTLAVFFNVHMGLILNYPSNGFNMLTKISTPPMSIINSVILIILFFASLPYLFTQVSRFLILVPAILIPLGLFAGNFSYLAQGKVSLTKFRPIISNQGFGELQINRATNSSKGWKEWSRLAVEYFYYRNGFGTHAYSNQTFDINKKFRRFKADFGIDIEAPTPASVQFQVFGDGKQLFQSKIMGRFDMPEHLDVDVTGVRYLGLVVTDAGDGINSDHGDWLNPILYK